MAGGQGRPPLRRYNAPVSSAARGGDSPAKKLVIASQSTDWRGNLRIRVTDSHVAALCSVAVPKISQRH